MIYMDTTGELFDFTESTIIFNDNFMENLLGDFIDDNDLLDDNGKYLISEEMIHLFMRRSQFLNK